VACIGFVFGLVALGPVAQAAKSLELVRLRRNQLHQQPKSEQAAREAVQVVTLIGHHLKEARQADPYDTRPQLESAQWFLELCENLHNAKQGDEALKCLTRARELDPVGTEADRMTFEVRLHLAELFEDHRKDNLTEAVGLIDPLLTRDPTLAAQLHFRLAAAFFQLKDRKEFLEQAQQALKLEAEAPGPAYKLPGPQLEKLKEWLRAPPPT
jgi:tetratricopeptide (TPR) repeat protein